MNARYRPITRLGLGGTGLGDMYHATSDTAAMATVDAAWDAGIRYFDTAPHYGAGLSEHRFGQALRRCNSALRIRSSPRRSPAPAARSTCGATRL